MSGHDWTSLREAASVSLHVSEAQVHEEADGREQTSLVAFVLRAADPGARSFVARGHEEY